MSADPHSTGLRVLQALQEGRQRAIAAKQAQSASFVAAVRGELDRDILAGHPVRGRAGRIARRLHGDLRRSVRQVQRVLDALFSASN